MENIMMTKRNSQKLKPSNSPSGDSPININETNSKEFEQIPLQEDQCRHLIDVISEHMACFTVVGFDYAGNPVSLCVVQNALQDMALTSLISNFSDRLQMSQLGDAEE
jgi:hypothetical protein